MRDEPRQPRTVYRRPPTGGWDGGPRHRRTSAERVLPDRRWPRRVLITANVLVALCLVGAASAYGYVQWRLDQIHREKLVNLSSGTGSSGSSAHNKGGPPFTVLIVGSDTRSALSDGNAFGGATVGGGQRSDTVILARVVPATRQITLLSIPRDLWVNIPGRGQDRINSAFDTSADLLVQTIQQDLGIPINHYVEVNFDTFRSISDAVGGIGFYFPTPAKDEYSNLNIIQSGCYDLSGDSALAFVRSRHYQYYQDGYWHYEAQSDLARIQRQQAFIKKMLKKAEGEYTNPLALNNVIAGITKNLTVDSAFSNSLILDMARDFRSVNASAIPTFTLPNYAFTTSGGAEVLGLQQPQAAQTIAAFNSFGSPTPTAAPTTTTTPVPSVPQVSVSPSSVQVEVVNGTGAAGQASQMSLALNTLGYAHVTVGPSPGYGHPTTEILYAPDSLAAAQQLAARIPGGATIAVSPELVPTAYNLEVVTGSSFSAGGTSGTASGGATTSSSPVVSTTTTTVPGLNSGTYVLPGLAAGQAAPAC